MRWRRPWQRVGWLDCEPRSSRRDTFTLTVWAKSHFEWRNTHSFNPSRAADNARCTDEVLPSTSVMLTSGLHHLNDDLREDVTGQSSRNPKLINVISFKVPDDSRLTRTICSCVPPVNQRPKKPTTPFLFCFPNIEIWKSKRCLFIFSADTQWH